MLLALQGPLEVPLPREKGEFLGQRDLQAGLATMAHLAPLASLA